MKRVAQMTPKEAIAKIKKFDREHKGCSQLPIIMRIGKEKMTCGQVTEDNLCCLYGATYNSDSRHLWWQSELDPIPRKWHYGVDFDIGDDLLRIQIMKIPGSKTEPDVKKRKWTPLKPEELESYQGKYTKVYIDLRNGGRAYFEDGTCCLFSKTDFPYFYSTTRGRRRLHSAVWTYAFRSPQSKMLEISNILINTYKKTRCQWFMNDLQESTYIPAGRLLDLAISQQYTNASKNSPSDREKEIAAMQKLVDVDKVVRELSPFNDAHIIKSDKVGNVYMFYWNYTNRVYGYGCDWQHPEMEHVYYVTMINGKKTTSFCIKKDKKSGSMKCEHVQNKDVIIDANTVDMCHAMQIFKDHPKLSWVTGFRSCHIHIYPHQIPDLDKAYPVEQFVKMGLPYLALGCLYNGSFIRNRSQSYLAFELSEIKSYTSALKLYGISRQQAEYINDKIQHASDTFNNNNRYDVGDGVTESIVKYLRDLLGEDDDLPKYGETINMMVDFLFNGRRSPEKQYKWHIPPHALRKGCVYRKNILRLIKMYTDALKDPERYLSVGYVGDAIDMWFSENNYNTAGFWGEDGVASTLRNLHDISVLHDHLVELRNNRRNHYGWWSPTKQLTVAEQESLRKKHEKELQEVCEKYSFIGDEFRIVVPMRAADIVNEGQMLGHCVGGYADRHMERITTILFLRKNSDPEKSFYTIEVHDIKNNPTVQQIHGKFNRWIGTDPDAMRFAYHYLRDHNIYCDKNILLNTSMQYGSCGGTRLPESELY